MPEDTHEPDAPARRPEEFGSGPDGTGGDDSDGDGQRKRRKRRAPLWVETLVLLVVALVMALLIKTFLVQAFYIPSASMEPGLVKDDRILVQKPSYWFGTPSRGDTIVFEDPGGWLREPTPAPMTLLAKGLSKVGLYPTGGHLVKRVIGVPGDTIVCCDDDGRLEVNGEAIDEDEFIRPQPDPPNGCDGPMGPTSPDGSCDWTVTVPEDRLFVMGDNRAQSEDSSARLCAPGQRRCNDDRAFVPIDLVVGKVFSLVWPLDHAEFIGRPDVFDTIPSP